MKTRTGFVSNSSSSSFILHKAYVTPDQIAKIIDHQNSGEEWAEEWPWKIEERETTILGEVFMDNFDMREYMSKLGIDVDNEEVVEWEGNAAELW